jgi:hypothetical protein
MKLVVDSSSPCQTICPGVWQRKVGFSDAKRLSDGSLYHIGFQRLFPAFIREGALDIKDYRAVRKQLLNDVRDATILQLTPSVISHSVKLLENNVLRAMDALHVACAIEWQADLFVTSHRRQLLAAKNAGLRTEYLGQSTDLSDPKGRAAD